MQKKKGYIAYTLTSHSQWLIVSKFTPKFKQISAHHITHLYGVPMDTPLPEKPKSTKIIGYTSDEAIEALIVEIDGTTLRSDGGIYHITLSFEPDKRKPNDSNKITNNWKQVEPFQIEVEPTINR